MRSFLIFWIPTRTVMRVVTVWPCDASIILSPFSKRVWAILSPPLSYPPLRPNLWWLLRRAAALQELRPSDQSFRGCHRRILGRNEDCSPFAAYRAMLRVQFELAMTSERLQKDGQAAMQKATGASPNSSPKDQNRPSWRAF